jgi:tetratricopeptide (TPR) repeat protein
MTYVWENGMKKALTFGILGMVWVGLVFLTGCSKTPEGKLASARDLLAEGKYDQAKSLIDDLVKADSTAPDGIYGQGLLRQYRGLDWDAMIKYMEAAPLQNGYFPAMQAFLNIAIDLDYLANARKMAVILSNRDPENPEWYLKLAAIDMRQDAFDDARQSLDQADSLGADRSDLTLARAELAFRSYDSDSITQAIGRLMQVRLTDAEQYHRLASLYRYMNMYDSAVAAERRAVDKTPKNVYYRLQLAQYLFDQRHLHEANAIVDTLLAQSTDYGPAFILDAYIQWAMGNDADADLKFLKFLNTVTDSPIGLEKNGDLYGYFGVTRAAQMSWQSAYTIAKSLGYPDDYIARVYIKMENGFLDDRNLAMAVDNFEEGRKLLSNSPQIYFFEAELKSRFPETADSARMMVDQKLQKNWNDQLWLELAGQYSYRVHKYDQAIEIYRRLLELPYPKEVYLLNLLSIYAEQKNWQATDTIAENLPIRLRGSRQIQEKLYDVYNASERWESALTHAEKLYHLAPGYMPYVQDLARLYTLQNRIDDAHRLYETYVAGYPSDPEGYYRLGHYELEHDMIDLIPGRFQKALAIDTGYAFAYELKGLYWQHKGNLDSATYYYRKAISFQGATGESYYYLSEYHFKKGDSLSYAAGLAMAAARYLNRDPRSYMLLGNIYFAQGKYKLARLQYYKGVTLFPDDPEFKFLLGEAHFKLEEKAKAKTYLQLALDSGLAEPQRSEAKKMLAKL